VASRVVTTRFVLRTDVSARSDSSIELRRVRADPRHQRGFVHACQPDLSSSFQTKVQSQTPHSTTDLPDGRWFGTLKTVESDAGTLGLDLACCYGGGAANHAARAAGYPYQYPTTTSFTTRITSTDCAPSQTLPSDSSAPTTPPLRTTRPKRGSPRRRPRSTTRSGST